MENSFETRYQTGDTPWDHGMVDFNLIHAIDRHQIQPCHALDIGCGTGDNALWLAQHGFEITGCDLSATAIQRATEKAKEQNIRGHFVAADFLNTSIPNAPFHFAFDRGCLHCIPTNEGQHQFAAKVAALLDDGGIWLSLVGNADEPTREIGPPQLSATELVAIVEPHFEILSLQSSHFGSDQTDPARAWATLLRKR